MIAGTLIGLAITEQYDIEAIEAGRYPDRFTSRQWHDKRCKSLCSRCGQVSLATWFTLLALFFWL